MKHDDLLQISLETTVRNGGLVDLLSLYNTMVLDDQLDAQYVSLGSDPARSVDP